MQGVLASMIGSNDSSSWGYKCCHTDQFSLDYSDLRHGHAPASKPSLKEPLDNAPQDGHLTDN